MFPGSRLRGEEEREEGEEEEVFHVVVELEDKVKATPLKADALWMLLVRTARREYAVENTFISMPSAKESRIMTF